MVRLGALLVGVLSLPLALGVASHYDAPTLLTPVAVEAPEVDQCEVGAQSYMGQFDPGAEWVYPGGSFSSYFRFVYGRKGEFVMRPRDLAHEYQLWCDENGAEEAQRRTDRMAREMGAL